VPNCTVADGSATPDPCVSTRTLNPRQNVELRILTSAGSLWNFGVQVANTSSCTATGVGFIPGGRSFAFQVRYVAGAASPEGAVLFRGYPSPGLFRSTAVTRLECSGGQAAIEGAGLIGHTAVTFRAVVTDGGAHDDRFAIAWPGYAASGPVVLGAIRVQ